MQTNETLIEYSSNNSGGNWWLKDKDWKNLEKQGWEVEWVADSDSALMKSSGDGRFLGALAKRATKRGFATLAEGIREFETITKANTMDEGCNCCGPPHSFSWHPDGDEENFEGYEHASGEEIGALLFGSAAPSTLREALEKAVEINEH